MFSFYLALDNYQLGNHNYLAIAKWSCADNMLQNHPQDIELGKSMAPQPILNQCVHQHTYDYNLLIYVASFDKISNISVNEYMTMNITTTSNRLTTTSFITFILNENNNRTAAMTSVFRSVSLHSTTLLLLQKQHSYYIMLHL